MLLIFVTYALEKVFKAFFYWPNRMQIEHILNAIHPLPSASFERLAKHLQEVNFPKGYPLLEANRIERKIYFLSKGLVRAYAPQEEHDVSFWFGIEGDVILSMQSYVAKQKAYENVELLEDSKLYGIAIERLQELYQEDIHIANLGRVMVERELLKMEKRWISSQIKSAKERYDELMQDAPQIIQRVPLKYIASYLRMTPVSLSRIRKGIK